MSYKNGRCCLRSLSPRVTLFLVSTCHVVSGPRNPLGPQVSLSLMFVLSQIVALSLQLWCRSASVAILPL